MKTPYQIAEETAANMCNWRATQFHRAVLCFCIALIVAALSIASLI